MILCKIKIRKHVAAFFTSLVVFPLAFSACDFVNPTKVRNPQTTVESLREGGTGATKPFLNGVRFRFADAIEDVAYYTDVVSDDYDNTSTFISPQTDFPTSIFPTALTLESSTSGPFFEVQELRALADFLLTGVIPNDAEATDEQKAEALFYRGMANLLAAENFVAVPIVENGPTLNDAQLLQLAIDDFKAALATSQHANFPTRIHLVLVRAYRLAGDKAQAATEANLALAGPSDFVFFADYDAANNINNCFNFGVSRPSYDVQPLPRGGAQVVVPTISGTSLDATAVAALTNPEEILHALYLARQEIFFYEGRRMNDLGIRLPVMQREIDTNTRLHPGDPGTVALVPAYIPADDGLDSFTISGNNTIIAVDMNQVMVDNRVSPFTLPF